MSWKAVLLTKDFYETLEDIYKIFSMSSKKKVLKKDFYKVLSEILREIAFNSEVRNSKIIIKFKNKTKYSKEPYLEII